MMVKQSVSFLGAFLWAAASAPVAAEPTGEGVMLPSDTVEWQEASPGSPVQVAVLWGDPATGAHGRLIKLPAGFEAPIHAHTGDYHGVNLTGTWRHSFETTGEERVLPRGSYVFQPGSEMHGDACVGPEDCILLLVQDEKADFIPRE